MSLPLKVFVLTVVVGAAAASAQIEDSVVDPSRVVIASTRPSVGGYSERSAVYVYNIGTPAESGGDWRSSGTNVYDDVTFTGTSGRLLINGIRIALIVPNPMPTDVTAVFLRVTFFPNHNNAVAATQPPYSGTPVVWNLRIVGDFQHAAGSIGEFTVVPVDPLICTLDATNVFNGGPGDRTCGVYEQVFTNGSSQMSGAFQIARRGLWTAPLVGSTDYYGWFDGTANGTQYDIVNGSRSGGTLATSRATFLTLSAHVPTPCPADADDDGGVTIEDLLTYLTWMTRGLIAADLDDGTGTGTPDGAVTIDDLIFFLQRFTLGC